MTKRLRDFISALAHLGRRPVAVYQWNGATLICFPGRLTTSDRAAIRAAWNSHETSRLPVL